MARQIVAPARDARQRTYPEVQQLEPPPMGPADLRARLAEAEEALRAIRNGEVDALVVRGASPAAQVFTLTSADRPYRMFVENMRDGAATVSDAGIVLYANRRLAVLLDCPLEHIIGAPIASLLADGDGATLRAIGGCAGPGGAVEAELLAGNGKRVPARINASTLNVDGHELLCLTFGDLTHQNAQKSEINRLGRAQDKRLRQLERAQAELTERATHDQLTSLPNRTLLIARLTRALSLSRASGKSTGLIFVDLDRFKEVNDTRGHAEGDAVLRQVAERLAAAVRPMDSVARLGGDEFVVLLPGLEHPDDAIPIGKRLATAIDIPIALERGTVSMSASIGISVSDPAATPDADPDDLLHKADTAMYRAKALGGSRIELFDAGSVSRESDRETWIARIREAIDEDRFVLHAQPIVELATGTVVQQELLLRMQGRDGELITPLAFLPTAETCGLIGEIDNWVIAQAIKIAARGQAVAVNLSAACTGDPGVLDRIEHELGAQGTDPGNLVFEITETAVMQNMDRASLFAERLVALGCRFALDDFGTGFASFMYLKRLPVQYLKIDIEFVRNLVHSERDMSVVRAIVALAGDFNQQTIAEGVEDEATAGVLRDLGVTFAQGYLFGSPGALPERGLTREQHTTWIPQTNDRRVPPCDLPFGSDD